ncbi:MULTISPECIES: hypothetical protein [unclassified Roseitalea]|uniref:hypothetical protein n=1 Tax=unclassified Roseitalea TaxID=2639107 RepID=UPI00273DA257|nr:MULTISPECIES: hypothetical protein [unclassified Roseitalea]
MSAAIEQPVRDTEMPESPAIAVGALLGKGDVDRLASVTHALIEEIADLAVRIERIEARLDGSDAPEDLAAVHKQTAALVGRVLG